jgi:hypothetical protein
MLMHASHSCIIVTETPENKPIEPAETVEPEPGVEFIVELEENQGKQLSIIPFTHSICFNLVISVGYMWLCYMFIYASLILLSCIYFSYFIFISMPLSN